jgi:hypothetical protein
MLVKPKALESLARYCEYDFSYCEGSEKIIILLPSAYSGDRQPHFSRISWKNHLAWDFHVLYLADPYQGFTEYKGSSGSWFISPEGRSTLCDLAEHLKLLISELEANSVILYGSSMGGYASMMLACMIENTKAISECPQIYLNRHPGSRYVCEHILGKGVTSSEIEPGYHLSSASEIYVRIICSIHDAHYSNQVAPFIEDVKKLENDKVTMDVRLYCDSSYPKGHVALNRDDAIAVIRDVCG